jgi:predicted ribosomally synthesized peptide with SipW-like signal peptide
VTKNTADQTTQRAARRKVAAVLAGGLVLGVGTMATLASWNDSEFASATFTAGKFNLEGAVDASQATFGEHAASGSAGALTFTAPFNNLTPTDVVAAPFAIRLAAGTTNDAKVTLTAATNTSGTVTNLTYEVPGRWPRQGRHSRSCPSSRPCPLRCRRHGWRRRRHR